MFVRSSSGFFSMFDAGMHGFSKVTTFFRVLVSHFTDGLRMSMSKLFKLLSVGCMAVSELLFKTVDFGELVLETFELSMEVLDFDVFLDGNL